MKEVYQHVLSISANTYKWVLASVVLVLGMYYIY